ncbi:MAG: hypothetical protein ACK5GN_02175 [Pseudomonadota bacterium]|jgi:hypothetical protein
MSRVIGHLEAQCNWLGGITLFLFVLCSGCAQSRTVYPRAPGSIAAVVQASSHNLEVSATPEDQARQEVAATPTVFTVAFADDPYSWERARFFLENYTGGGSGHASAVMGIAGDRWSLSSNPAAQQYRYEVSKDAGEGEFTYHVSCLPGVGGDPAQAALNAGNLARFIRDGTLEVSLLGKPS